ncbi:MAG TPA: PAS domain-containing protein [Longimicrobiaceae bacterium]
MNATFHEEAEVLTEDELDRLPFGVIQLSTLGRVLRYNRAEAELAGMEAAGVVGRNFFTEIAPCTRVQKFYGAFLEGVARGELNELFPFEFEFRDGRRRDVVISMFYSRTSDSVWVVVERP